MISMTYVKVNFFFSITVFISIWEAVHGQISQPWAHHSTKKYVGVLTKKKNRSQNKMYMCICGICICGNIVGWERSCIKTHTNVLSVAQAFYNSLKYWSHSKPQCLKALHTFYISVTPTLPFLIRHFDISFFCSLVRYYRIVPIIQMHISACSNLQTSPKTWNADMKDISGLLRWHCIW